MIRHLHFILLFPLFLCQSWIQKSEMIAEPIAWKTALVTINTRFFPLFSELFKHVELLATICSLTQCRYKAISFSPPTFSFSPSPMQKFFTVLWPWNSALVKALFPISTSWVTWPDHFMYSLHVKTREHAPMLKSPRRSRSMLIDRRQGCFRESTCHYL